MDKKIIIAGIVSAAIAAYSLIVGVNVVEGNGGVKKKPQVRRRKPRTPFHLRGLYKDFLNDDTNVRAMTRLEITQFRYVLSVVEEDIRPKRHFGVPAVLKLLITLHFLAHGITRRKAAIDFKIDIGVISRIIDETTKAICKNLGPLVLSPPTEEEWLHTAEGFNGRWNVPNMLGSVDGKHIKIQKPQRSGSTFYNYKQYFSIVLMAVADYDYKFISVDIGQCGSNHDSWIFKESFVGKAIYEGKAKDLLNWPGERTIPGINKLCPYFFIGDDAFALHFNLMKPYPGINLPMKKRICNYRLSRARQVIENTFGILAARWRLLQTTFIASPEQASYYIYAMVALHNYMAKCRVPYYIPDGFQDREAPDGKIIEGNYRKESQNTQLSPLDPTTRNNYTRDAGDLRNSLADYFITEEGALPWQERHVNRS